MFRWISHCFLDMLLGFSLSFIVWHHFYACERSAKWKSPRSTLKGVTLSHRNHGFYTASKAWFGVEPYFHNVCASLCNRHYINIYFWIYLLWNICTTVSQQTNSCYCWRMLFKITLPCLWLATSCKCFNSQVQLATIKVWTWKCYQNAIIV